MAAAAEEEQEGQRKKSEEAEEEEGGRQEEWQTLGQLEQWMMLLVEEVGEDEAIEERSEEE